MKIALAAGGSGGHLYPCIEIYKELIKGGHEVTLFGSTSKIEEYINNLEKIPYHKYHFIGLKKGLISKIKFLYYFIKSYKKIKKELIKEKFDVALGFGGYPSLAVLFACGKLKIPYFLHEQNALIGRTNKFLLKKCQKIITCFDKTYGLENNEKAIHLGNPRQFKIEKKVHNGFNVLIIMGSQGSSKVNDLLLPILNNNEYNVKLVTGKNDFDRYAMYAPKTVAYIKNMKEELQTTDLIISRAGATTISEISSIGLPSILIPSPYVINNHQVLNAKEYVKEWGIMIEEKNVSVNLLNEFILKIKNDYYYYYHLKKNAENFTKKDALKNIVGLITTYAKK